MPTARLCLAAVVAATALAACGSSSSPSTTASTTASTANNASGPATVKVIKVPGYGSALATSSGKALYILSSDKTNSSSCSGSCATTWPALTVTGKPVAGSGVTASLLSDFKRGSGNQVSYDGHALYTFSGGTIEDGDAEDGGVWYLVSAKGTPIKHATQHGY